MKFHSYLISLFGIILLLKSFISSFQIPTVIYNLADETPTGSLIGNIAENLSPDYVQKYTFLLISSIKFQYISDFFKITPNGDLITLRNIDRDDTNDICGPLDCCSSVVCQIEANVILTRQWDTTWKQDYHPPKHSLVKNNHNPDEEEYRLNSVKLNVSNQKNIIRLYIRINDANDNPPRFMSTNLMKYDPSNESHQLLNRPFIIYIREGDTSGFEGLPIASDADSEVNGIVMYKLIEQTSSGDPVKEPCLNISMTYSHGNSISSHHLNPKLILLRSLDYERLDDREIYATFYAIDGGDPSLTGSLSIIVRLLDMNDNPPIIQQYTATEQLITLPENTTMDDKPFFIVNATDADSGENGRLTYTFSPLANSLVPVKFNIDSRNGAITIREPLDYEIYSERQFILPIVVKDAGSPQLSSTTTIYVQIKDINDNIPTLVVQENMTVPEEQMFTKPIVRFYVRDEDEVSHGKITCKPIQLNTSHLHDKELIAGYDYLRLHPISDTVFFIFTKGIFDYEKIPRASILIECYDLADHIDHLETLNITQQLNEIQAQQQQHPQHPQQQPLKSFPLRITIAISDQNDNIPLFIQSKYYVQIPEHIPDGSFIMEIKAYDLDHGEYGQLTYQLGPIIFNYIHDQVVEEGDEGGKHILPPSSPPSPPPHQQPFHIDPLTGRITVLHNQLLDHELIDFLNLTIIVKDKGNLTSTTQLIIQLIDINDHLPKLLNSINIDFIENQKINTFIDFIHLIDLDQNFNYSRIHLLLNNNNDQLINNQSINNRPIDNPYNHYIKMIPDPNFNYTKITKTELINEYELKALLISRSVIDREKVDQIFYKIITYNDNTDIELISSITYTLTINILDENDNIPICIYPIYNSIINYYDQDQDQDRDRDQDPDQDQDQDHSMMMVYTSTPIYSFILQIKGYDPDYDSNGTIIYQLNQYTNGSQFFYLNETSGKLYTNWLTHTYFPPHLDHAIQTNPSQIEPIEGIYQLKILLKDMGIPSLSKETQFYIKIHSLNIDLINKSIINNQSIKSNQKLPYWFNHHHWVLILVMISIILLLIIISSIILWIKSYCKLKLCSTIKSKCKPILIKSIKKQDQSLIIKPYQSNDLLKIDNIPSKLINNEIRSDNNMIDQSINNRYTTHYSINDHFNMNTTNNTTYNNDNNNDLFSYSNHLHTNPICSFPYSYETGSNNDYYHQSMGRRWTSGDPSNLYYSIRNSHPNISNTPLNNPDIEMYTDSNNNPNHNDGYLQSTIQRTYGNSIVYSGYTYSHLSPIHDLGYYDQYQNQQRNMKFC
ncbi:unnamed protein product [Schistosoma rodhaini]|uniref:Cadherin domain-containing protein n=1 Tax=Schistosoma rodhaini TaxID=6188 RepID=A0AA85FCR3_9TREM|nr:unnamed protein product [Schistosoma rodhaini]CAH8530117.1 unnamed protein product [Schistosoma rodhaini]